MSRKTVILIVIAIAVVATAGIVGYYWYQGSRYVATDDARIASNVVSVSPEIVGKVIEWRVKEGDIVQKDDILGRQDLGSALTSGALNPQAMGSVAGVVAEKAVLKAPITGQVILSSAVVGQMAAPGVSLAVIADTDGLYVSANIKEGDIARVRIGATVDVWIDAFHGRKFHGRVETIGRATASTFSLLPSQNGGGNYTKVVQVIPIKVSVIDAGDARLMIGMNAFIKIHVNERARSS
ncbi:MAG TPA: efflux RND transporter periplasmic adaptor subunit [Spirochaetia bacterium]|nr:efflux RND transporter periplasmic adaptor subunit [Spirochaetia bacterium]